jgi:hypothetical protein
MRGEPTSRTQRGGSRNSPQRKLPSEFLDLNHTRFTDRLTSVDREARSTPATPSGELRDRNTNSKADLRGSFAARCAHLCGGAVAGLVHSSVERSPPARDGDAQRRRRHGATAQREVPGAPKLWKGGMHAAEKCSKGGKSPFYSPWMNLISAQLRRDGTQAGEWLVSRSRSSSDPLQPLNELRDRDTSKFMILV